MSLFLGLVEIIRPAAVAPGFRGLVMEFGNIVPAQGPDPVGEL